MRYLLLLLALCTNLSLAQGFNVSGDKLYQLAAPVVQPPPVEVRLRGVNKNHWDMRTYGLKASGANAIRMVINFDLPEATNWSYVQADAFGNGFIPVIGNWKGTCKEDPASLSAIVDAWVAQAGTWTKLNQTGIVNIANEWGPIASYQRATKPWDMVPVYTWRDEYIKAVARMRAAGYTGALMIDAPGCGQNAVAVYRDGAAVLAADPLHNILFDVHVYGGFVLNPDAAWKTDYTKSMAALKASGLPIVIGEFGPGLNVGPSPTTITPDTVIATAEANGWGWFPWAFDDGPCQASPTNGAKGFDMVQTCFGDATHQGDLNYTPFGMAMVTKLRTLNAKP